MVTKMVTTKNPYISLYSKTFYYQCNQCNQYIELINWNTKNVSNIFIVNMVTWLHGYIENLLLYKDFSDVAVVTIYFDWEKLA